MVWQCCGRSKTAEIRRDQPEKKKEEGGQEMKITVRCYFIPADITFDLDSIHESYDQNNSTEIHFKNGYCIFVDRQHFEVESKKAKNL